ncbi:hypothetical protein SNE40_005400 [Patella caerulea]|uniref:Uncharacterized protein n=1 Tax=Patella caerulea TaxID=87958 RepID=A0AAN8K1L1_PATCE
MVAHSYESINSAIHSRGESSVTQIVDTSTVASGQELSINSNAILNAGILASNLSLPDDEDVIPISHDNGGVNEMNDISTVMTRPDHLTSALEILLTGNTRIAAGNEHRGECASYRNNYEQLQMRPQVVDNNTYTSLNDQITEL